MGEREGKSGWLAAGPRWRLGVTWLWGARMVHLYSACGLIVPSALQATPIMGQCAGMQRARKGGKACAMHCAWFRSKVKGWGSTGYEPLHCPHPHHRAHSPSQGFSVAEFLEAIQEAVDREAKEKQ